MSPKMQSLKIIPKTGLAGRMREWMKARRKRTFTNLDVYIELGLDSPSDREMIRAAIRDFKHRGEIVLLPPDKRIRRQNLNRYRYDHTWTGGRIGRLRPMICKAMYVSGTFAATDIERLTDLDRSWINKTINRLSRSGHLSIVGRRVCANGSGAEAVYHIADRDKFRLEVMPS